MRSSQGYCTRQPPDCTRGADFTGLKGMIMGHFSPGTCAGRPSPSSAVLSEDHASMAARVGRFLGKRVVLSLAGAALRPAGPHMQCHTWLKRQGRLWHCQRWVDSSFAGSHTEASMPLTPIRVDPVDQASGQLEAWQVLHWDLQRRHCAGSRT